MFSRRFIRLYLLMAVLMTFLASSGLLLAQEKRIDLMLTLLPGYYNYDVTPGKETILILQVKNNGNNELTNIRFDSRGPESWVVTFNPGSIDRLSAGSSQVVDVSITPPRTASRDNYNLTILAEANETRSATTAFLRVEGDNIWLWVGIGVGVLVAAGFVIIFLRFGK